MAFRVEVLRRHAFLDDFPLVQDLALVVDMTIAGSQLLVLPDVVFAYRRHDASASSETLVDGGRFERERAYFAIAARSCAAARLAARRARGTTAPGLAAVRRDAAAQAALGGRSWRLSRDAGSARRAARDPARACRNTSSRRVRDPLPAELLRPGRAPPPPRGSSRSTSVATGCDRGGDVGAGRGGRTTSAASPPTSRSTGMSEASTGSPAAIASSTGSPKPSTGSASPLRAPGRRGRSSSSSLTQPAQVDPVAEAGLGDHRARAGPSPSAAPVMTSRGRIVLVDAAPARGSGPSKFL